MKISLRKRLLEACCREYAEKSVQSIGLKLDRESNLKLLCERRKPQKMSTATKSRIHACMVHNFCNYSSLLDTCGMVDRIIKKISLTMVAKGKVLLHEMK